MKINKEGYKIIGITGLICLLLGTGIYRLLSSHDNGTLVWVLVVLMLLFWFFIVAFFREPRRVKIHDADLVFSPCDGRVVVTEPVHESEYLDREMMQISIFMSITNVHMNWRGTPSPRPRTSGRRPSCAWTTAVTCCSVRSPDSSHGVSSPT